MKKSVLIILAFALVCSYSFSQNEIELDFKTKEQARQFSDSLLFSSDVKYTFYKDAEINNKYVLKYFPDSLTAEEIKTDNAESCTQCVIVAFKIGFKNSNPDLKIEGEKYFGFQAASGTYLTLFPVWKKYFNMNADLVKTTNSNFETRSINLKKHVLFQKEQSLHKDVQHWQIYYLTNK